MTSADPICPPIDTPPPPTANRLFIFGSRAYLSAAGPIHGSESITLGKLTKSPPKFLSQGAWLFRRRRFLPLAAVLSWDPKPVLATVVCTYMTYMYISYFSKYRGTSAILIGHIYVCMYVYVEIRGVHVNRLYLGSWQGHDFLRVPWRMRLAADSTLSAK